MSVCVGMRITVGKHQGGATMGAMALSKYKADEEKATARTGQMNSAS